MKRNTSRTENSIINMTWGAIANIVVLLLNFVSRTVFIYSIGTVYLGINGLFTNVLGMLSITELGIGTAINFSLYKPVAEEDREKVKSLMLLYKRAYRIIAVIVGSIGLILLPFISYLIKDDGGIKNLTLYYVIFLFNSVSSYFVTYKYGLVYADQKGYLLNNIDMCCRLVTTVIQIIVLLVWKSFLIYLLVQTVLQLLQKIITGIYINRVYPYLEEKKVSPLQAEEGARIKHNVKALLLHKIGEISVYQTDNIIISSFVSILAVGLISNYNLILTTITGFLMIFFNAITASLGNLVATEEKDKQYRILSVYNFIGCWLYGVTSVCFIALFQIFIRCWIGSENLLDWSVVVMLVVCYYISGQRMTITNFKTVSGIFSQDRYVALIQAVVNVVVSIAMVQIFGLAGVYVGTILSGLIPTIVRPIIVYKVAFDRLAIEYFRQAIQFFSASVGVSFLLLQLNQSILRITTLNWFSMIMIAILTFVLANLIFIFLFRKNVEFQYLYEKINSTFYKWRNRHGQC